MKFLSSLDSLNQAQAIHLFANTSEDAPPGCGSQLTSNQHVTGARVSLSGSSLPAMIRVHAAQYHAQSAFSNDLLRQLYYLRFVTKSE